MRQLACFIVGVLSALSADAAAFVKLSDASVYLAAAGAESATLKFTIIIGPSKPGKLIEVSSPVAGATEFRSMTRDEDDEMKMLAVESLPLPASRKANLGNNKKTQIMLLNLNRPLKEGDRVPFTVMVQFSDRTKGWSEATAVVEPIPDDHGHETTDKSPEAVDK